MWLRCICLRSLSIIFSSVVVGVSINTSLLFMVGEYYTVWRYHIYFTHHQLMGFGAVSNLQLLWIMPLWTFSTSLCVDICFQFSWVNTCEQNCWVVSTSNLLRSYYTGFHGSYAFLHSHQQCMRASQKWHLNFFGSQVFFKKKKSLKIKVK